MAIRADYHLHSDFSGDSEARMDEMIGKGIELGLQHMCFTEHMDMDFPVSESAPADFFLVNTDSYLYDCIRCREKYSCRIDIRFGIELGIQPHLAKELAKYVKSYDFDFVIASTHISHGKNPYEAKFYEGRSDREAYGEYFLSVLENLKKFSNFDVLGHLDYTVRYGPNKDENYHYADYREVFEEILSLLVRQEKGLEINTGALRCHLKELNPCTDVIKRYRELGGEIITVGSDAHSPEQVGQGFALAADILNNCGFRYYTTFKGRMPEFHTL